MADEIWGIFTLVYEPEDEHTPGHISVMDFKPFKPYEVDLDYFKEGVRSSPWRSGLMFS